MNFLPYENFRLKSQLTEDEIRRRLKHLTQRGKEFRISPENKTVFRPYDGSFQKNSFSFYRDIRYHNSFLPHISGTFETRPDGVHIAIKMQVPLILIVIMGVAFLVALIFLIATTFLWTEPRSLVAIAAPLFVYLMTTIGFKIESIPSKKELKLLFEAEETPESTRDQLE